MKRVFASIGTSMLGLIVFYLVRGLVNILCSILFYLLDKIPVIDFIFSWLSRASDGLILPVLSPTVACLVALGLISILNKTGSTYKLTCTLLGCYLIILNILFIIIDLAAGDYGILNYITTAIAGIAIFYTGRKV